MTKSTVVLAFVLFAFSAAAATFDSSVLLLRERKLNEAERGFRQVIASDPKNAQARLMLARTLLELGRDAEAVAEVEQALAAENRPEVQFQAGRLLRGLAERHLIRLQELAPGSPATLELEGELLEWAGNLDGALQQYAAAAKLDPKRPGIHYRIGNIYWRKRNAPEAMAALTKELATTPHHGMANLRMGQLLNETGDQNERAIGYLTKAHEALPDSTEVRRELGKAYKALGRLAEARAQWEAVAQMSPADDRVHYLLGGLYRELGEAAMARKAFERHREILKQRLQQSIER